MNTTKIGFLLYFSLMTLCLTGCARNANDVWDDTRTAGRHVGRGLRSLGGKHGDSRQVNCREDFIRCEGNFPVEDYSAMEFEPLPDQEYSREVSMSTAQAKVEPGTPMSRIPGIESFKDPLNDPQLSKIFKIISFPYNSSLLKGEDNLNAIRAIARYMKNQPDTYIFVEGHCDERGAEAYNLALGSRRSNSVRNLLIKEGVSPENIFTVSYGKERPLDSGHNESAWSKNRRVQFKVYQP